MKRCINCNAEISDSAKFCGICRAKQPVAGLPTTSEAPTCPSCGTSISASAKFCHSCGVPLHGSIPISAETHNSKDIESQRGFVTWRILPGQIAVKIDQHELSSYGLIRGVYVAPGTKALFFVNGKLAATLQSGRYSFNDLKSDSNSSASAPGSNGVLGFLRNIANHISNGVSALLNLPGYPFYSVMLCRESDFPLVYEFNNVPTASIRCDIGLHFLCKITDFNAFADTLLADKKFVTLESVASHLQPVIRNAVNQAFIHTDPQKINEDATISAQILAALSYRIAEVYPYLAPVQIINITANNQELERIRNLQEELYISEQELQQTQLRYDFLNRLQDVERNNQLRNARSEADFELLVNDIARSSSLKESRANVNYEGEMFTITQDAMRNKDNQAAFVLMLTAERQLREARTQDEVEAALSKLQQSHMLRDEEIAVLNEQINHRAAMVRVANNQEISLAELEAGQLLALASVRAEMAVDAEKLRWEIEVGNKRLDNDLQNERKKRLFEEEKRQSDAEFHHKQMNNQLDLLRQAEEIRNAREEAKHRREMEAIRVSKESEIKSLEIMSNMSYEQIMAANPNISPEAAKALAEKYKAQAATANAEKIEELNRQHNEDLKEMVRLSMSLARDSIHAQNNANDLRMKDKEAELERSQKMSERSADRVLESVKSTVTAVSGQPQFFTPSVPISAGQIVPTVISCPKCGTKNTKGSAFCEECGTDIKK